MLQRIDDLDRDNENLREEIAELEDVKEQLQERIDRAEERRREIEREYREQKVQYALHVVFITFQSIKPQYDYAWNCLILLTHGRFTVYTKLN